MALAGRHLLINIGLPDLGPLSRVQKDPRKARLKPAAYVGVVEEVGPDVTLVQPGSQVVVERWSYTQIDVDDERLLAHEKELLVIAEGQPAPGVLILDLVMPREVQTELILLAPTKTYSSHCGVVVASNDELAEPGEMLWLQSGEYGQFLYQDGKRLAFRNDKRSFVLLRGWPEAYQQKKRAQLEMTGPAFDAFMDRHRFFSVP